MGERKRKRKQLENAGKPPVLGMRLIDDKGQEVPVHVTGVFRCSPIKGTNKIDAKSIQYLWREVEQ